MLEAAQTAIPYEALKRTQDAMSSRLLLVRLRRLHYEHAPKEYKDQFLPVLYRGPSAWISRRASTTPESSLNFDGLRPIARAAPLRTILIAVAHYYRKRECDILGQRRTPDLINPRHVAFYVATELADTSIAQIGRFFRRDHTSILYARRAITLKMEADPVLALQVQTIKQQIAELEHMPKADHVKRMREKASLHFRRSAS